MFELAAARGFAGTRMLFAVAALVVDAAAWAVVSAVLVVFVVVVVVVAASSSISSSSAFSRTVDTTIWLETLEDFIAPSCMASSTRGRLRRRSKDAEARGPSRAVEGRKTEAGFPLSNKRRDRFNEVAAADAARDEGSEAKGVVMVMLCLCEFEHISPQMGGRNEVVANRASQGGSTDRPSELHFAKAL